MKTETQVVKEPKKEKLVYYGPKNRIKTKVIYYGPEPKPKTIYYGPEPKPKTPKPRAPKAEKKVYENQAPPAEKPYKEDGDLIVDVNSPGFFDMFVTKNGSKHAWCLLASAFVIAWYVLDFSGVPDSTIGQEQFWYFIAAFTSMCILVLLGELFVSFVVQFLRSVSRVIDDFLDFLPGLSTVIGILRFVVELLLWNLVTFRLNVYATALMYLGYSSVKNDNVSISDSSPGFIEMLFLGNSIPISLPGTKTPYDTGDAFCRATTVGKLRKGKLGQFPFESLAKKVNTAILGLASQGGSTFSLETTTQFFQQMETPSTTEVPGGYITKATNGFLGFLFLPFQWGYETLVSPFIVFGKYMISCAFYGLLLFTSIAIGAMGADALYTWSMSFALSSVRNIGMTQSRVDDQLNQNIIKTILYTLGVPDYAGYVQLVAFIKERVNHPTPLQLASYNDQAAAIAYELSGAIKDRAFMSTPSRRFPGDQMLNQYVNSILNGNTQFDGNIQQFVLNVKVELYKQRINVIKSVFTYKNVYALRYPLASMGLNLAFVMNTQPSDAPNDYIGDQKLAEMFWYIENVSDDKQLEVAKATENYLAIAKYFTYEYIESDKFLQMKAFCSPNTRIIYPVKYDTSVRFEQLI